MLTKCYIMSEDQFDRVNQKLLNLHHSIKFIESDRRDDLLKSIRSIRADLIPDGYTFGGESND